MFGRVVPSLLFLILIAVLVWAVLRATAGRAALVPASASSISGSRRDGALDEVRLRYARGEISREEFVQRTQDLGGVGPGPGEPTPPEPG
jgi:uncharacterized membrane protein